MSDEFKDSEPVLIRPGGFNRRIEVRENVVMAILPPYLHLARAIARASRAKKRLDWGGLWDVPEKRGGFSIVGPAIGAPNAATMLESLIAFGAKNIIVVGCCGSIQPDLNIGDIVLPLKAISEEGVSAHYHPEKFPPEADAELSARIAAMARDKGWPIREGIVWTTDAPYRETCAKVKSYGEQGVLAVEMELSAMFTVAKFRGVKLAAALAVSDELASLKWRPGFLKPPFIVATTRAIRLAINTAASLRKR